VLANSFNKENTKTEDFDRVQNRTSLLNACGNLRPNLMFNLDSALGTTTHRNITAKLLLEKQLLRNKTRSMAAKTVAT
ncbi:MAG: hypothetical protein AAFY72_16550, partial [Cyanobacteria bacterium J06649_4]